MKRYNTKKKTFDDVTGIQMERSPQKWKTVYRDDHRQFSSSPVKDEAVEGEEELMDLETAHQNQKQYQ